MLPATAGALDDDRPPTEHDEEQRQRDDERHDVARVDVHHFTPKSRMNAPISTTPRVVQKTAKLTRSAAGRVPCPASRGQDHLQPEHGPEREDREERRPAEIDAGVPAVLGAEPEVRVLPALDRDRGEAEQEGGAGDRPPGRVAPRPASRCATQASATLTRTQTRIATPEPVGTETW